MQLPSALQCRTAHCPPSTGACPTRTAAVRKHCVCSSAGAHTRDLVDPPDPASTWRGDRVATCTASSTSQIAVLRSARFMISTVRRGAARSTRASALATTRRIPHMLQRRRTATTTALTALGRLRARRPRQEAPVGGARGSSGSAPRTHGLRWPPDLRGMIRCRSELSRLQVCICA